MKFAGSFIQRSSRNLKFAGMNSKLSTSEKSKVMSYCKHWKDIISKSSFVFWLRTLIFVEYEAHWGQIQNHKKLTRNSFQCIFDCLILTLILLLDFDEDGGSDLMGSPAYVLRPPSIGLCAFYSGLQCLLYFILCIQLLEYPMWCIFDWFDFDFYFYCWILTLILIVGFWRGWRRWSDGQPGMCVAPTLDCPVCIL